MTRHERKGEYQKSIEWHHSEVELVGMCSKCEHITSMKAKNFRYKICMDCLLNDGIRSFMAWLRKIDMGDGTISYVMSSEPIEDLDLAVGWDERHDFDIPAGEDDEDDTT